MFSRNFTTAQGNNSKVSVISWFFNLCGNKIKEHYRCIQQPTVNHWSLFVFWNLLICPCADKLKLPPGAKVSIFYPLLNVSDNKIISHLTDSWNERLMILSGHWHFIQNVYSLYMWKEDWKSWSKQLV